MKEPTEKCKNANSILSIAAQNNLKGANTMKTRKTSLRRVFASALAVTTAAAIVIAGTYGWSAISQIAKGTADGATQNGGGENQTGPGGRLHFDFDRDSGAAEVYAENFGTEPLFVRARLNVTTDLTDSEVSYSYGGDKIFMPTFLKDSTVLYSDVTGDAIDPERETAPVPEYPDYTEGQTKTDTAYYTDQTNAQATHRAKSTIVGAAPIAIADWDGDPVDRWFIDSDGWYYWGAPLAAGEATSLLLNAIEFKADRDDWEFVILPEAEFTTFDDVAEFTSTSPEADELLGVLAPEPADPSEPIVREPGPGGTLAAIGTTGGATATFWPARGENSDTILKGQVASITVVDEIDLTDAVHSWDVSAAGDESVMAWYTDAGGDMVDLFLGADGPVRTGLDASQMFSYFNNAETLDISCLDTSGSTRMNNMFSNLKSLTTFVGLETLDTSKVRQMWCMFMYMEKITELDVSSFDTSNVEEMTMMFCGTYALERIIGIEDFDTSKVTLMDSVFSSARSLTSLDLSGWNTSKATTMRALFFATHKLTELDLSGWNTSNVTLMDSMFRETKVLTNLDVSHFDTSKVTDMNQMFSNVALTSLDLRHFNTSRVTDMSKMFSNNTTLESLNLSGWNVGSATTMQSMFSSARALTSLDVSGWSATFGSLDMNNMFYGASALTSLDLSSFTNMNSMKNMFQNTTNLKYVDMRNTNLGNVTGANSTSMFYNSGMLDGGELIVKDQAAADRITSHGANNCPPEITIDNP